MNPELRLLDREFARRYPVLVEPRRSVTPADRLEGDLAHSHLTDPEIPEMVGAMIDHILQGYTRVNRIARTAWRITWRSWSMNWRGINEKRRPSSSQ